MVKTFQNDLPLPKKNSKNNDNFTNSSSKNKKNINLESESVPVIFYTVLSWWNNLVVGDFP